MLSLLCPSGEVVCSTVTWTGSRSRIDDVALVQDLMTSLDTGLVWWNQCSVLLRGRSAPPRSCSGPENTPPSLQSCSFLSLWTMLWLPVLHAAHRTFLRLFVSWHSWVRSRSGRRARCPDLVSSALSLVPWNMRCSQESCCTLFSPWQPATKSSPTLADSSPSSQTEVSVARCLRSCAWLGNFVQINAALLCSPLFRRPVIPVIPVTFVRRPPSEDQRWWRVPLPLSVSPLHRRESQAWPETTCITGTGFLQGRLQGSSFNVQSDCKQSPAFTCLHPGEEEWQRQQDTAPALGGELLPPPWDCAGISGERSCCSQHL